MKHILTALLVATLAACSGPAAAPASADGLQVSDAWSRATAPNAPVAGGYLTVTNHGNSPDRLVRVDSTASQRVEIHEMRHDDGVMRMRELVDGLPLPAGQATALKPGGNHLMFIQPVQPFVEGQTVQATLVFETASPQVVEFQVRPVSATSGSAHGDGHGKAPH